MKSPRFLGLVTALVAAVATGPAAAQCEIQKLTASDAAEGDAYGYALGASGSTIVVGAFHRDGAETGTGAAYLYEWNGSVWTDEVQLVAPDASQGDAFGTSVAIDGDLLVCGAPGNDDLAPGAGAVYVFRRIESAWTLDAKLTAGDGSAGASFGGRVAASGDVIVIGARDDDESGIRAGAAYVFRRSEPGWTQEAKLLAPDAMDDEQFGSAVAVDAGVAIIGAPGYAADRGRAVIFRFNEDAWTPDPGPLLGDDDPGADFGSEVDIDGDLALISAPDEQDDTGAAYAFRFDGAAWIREAKLTAPDGQAHDAFGSAVAVDEPHALIGAPFASTEEGAAYLFETKTWTDVARLARSDTRQSIGLDFFGGAVAIDGDTVLVGAYKDDDDGETSGSTYAFAARGPDCNGNGRGDCLDIAMGTSRDCNGDGIPDECGIDGRPGRTTILVPTDYPTIQAALDAAEDGDEVVVANGTYTGAGNYDLDFRGKAVVLRSEDCDPNRCIIDCDQMGRGFVFQSGEGPATQVSGFTIMRGRSNRDGGGLYLLYSSPTITNCTVLLCVSVSGDGGGLYSAGGDPSLINCTFNANAAEVNNGHGGAIDVHQGRPNISGCVLVGNTAAFEGAMRLRAVNPMTVRDCLFVANYGARFFGGGALAVESSSGVRMLDCVFDSNVTRLIGGGFYTVNAECTLHRCDFRHNAAGSFGGAVFASESSTILSECSFSFNTAAQSGGAVANEDGSECEFVDCVFEDNAAAADGGAICNRDGLVLLSSCLVRENAALRGGGMFSDTAALSVVRDSRFCANDPTNIEGPWTDDGGNTITRLCTGPCPADLDGDSVVGMSDVLTLLGAWGPCPGEDACPADLDDNGVVDFTDALAILATWGPCPKE